MSKFTKNLIVASILMMSVQVMAAECNINYTRIACNGKEAISFKKCDGKANCTKTSDVATAEECQVKAVKSCANDRLDITKSKVITASFGGKALKNKTGGSDFCQNYAEKSIEFNQCGN